VGGFGGKVAEKRHIQNVCMAGIEKLDASCVAGNMWALSFDATLEQ
jgi:hypothetical protein